MMSDADRVPLDFAQPAYALALQTALAEAVARVLERGVVLSREHAIEPRARGEWILAWAWETARLPLPLAPSLDVDCDVSRAVSAALEIIRRHASPEVPLPAVGRSFLSRLLDDVLLHGPVGEATWARWALLVYLVALSLLRETGEEPAW